uniref:Uncharacterized protein n=1 Tax=Triticum urartu TaxID=4572 RepID=A0A8R7TC94_TRIUA
MTICLYMCFCVACISLAMKNEFRGSCVIHNKSNKIYFYIII